MSCQDSLESVIDTFANKDAPLLRQQELSRRSMSQDARDPAWKRFKCKDQYSPSAAKAVLKPERSPFKAEECFVVSNEESSQELKTLATEQICGVATSFSSTECSQSVFLSTINITEVAMIMDSDFVFPKLKMRDKHFGIVTRVKSTPATEAMYLCSPLTPRCRAAKKYQKFQEPSCQNRSRHFFKFSKKFPRGQNSRLLGSTFQQYWSPLRLPQPPPLSTAIAAQQFLEMEQSQLSKYSTGRNFRMSKDEDSKIPITEHRGA